MERSQKHQAGCLRSACGVHGWRCGVSDAGARAVAAHLPAGLTALDLDVSESAARGAAPGLRKTVVSGLRPTRCREHARNLLIQGWTF